MVVAETAKFFRFGDVFNPLRPQDALKHHFKSLKIDLIFLQQRVLQ